MGRGAQFVTIGCLIVIAISLWSLASTAALVPALQPIVVRLPNVRQPPETEAAPTGRAGANAETA